MPTAAAPVRDYVREEIASLMRAKGVPPKDVIAATGMSKNTFYQFMAGKRGMRSGNSSKILAYLRARRSKG